MFMLDFCCAGSPAPKEKVHLDPSLPGFSIVIQRETGTPLGIQIDASRDKDRIQITQVIVDGPVADFNAQSTGLQIQAGDWIEKVNEATDSQGMAETLQSANSLKIKLLKSWAKLKKDKKKKKTEAGEDKDASPDAKAPDSTAPAPSPIATNGEAKEAPVAKKQEEEVKEAEPVPKGPTFKVDMNGLWVSDSMEESSDEIDAMMKDLGVPWMARKALKAANWGKGMTKFILRLNDEKCHLQSISPEKSEDDFYFGQGWKPHVDKGVHKQCLAEILEDGKGFKLAFKHKGEIEMEIKYMMLPNGKLRLPMSSPGKKIPTTIFKKA